LTLEQTESGVLDKIAESCLKNARQFINDAEILCSFKSYGHALALTVLSDIELGKTAIYAIWSKDLIAGTTLPPLFQSYFWEKKYGLFASKTWWVGLVIASNVEELVQELLDTSEIAGESASNGGAISPLSMQRITMIIEKMNSENRKLAELEDYRTKSFFVDFNNKDSSVVTPGIVQKSLVIDRIRKAKHRIKRGKPFLSLSLGEVQKRIARILIEEAFQNILPLSDRINQFILPVKE
jgi:hypothetical protein